MRRNLFKWHSYAALIAMLPILLITITGGLLVFKFEIDALLMPEGVTINEVGNQRAPLNELIPKINHTFSQYEIGSWEIFDDGYEVDRVYLIKRGEEFWYKVFLNPYSGEVLSEPQLLNYYFTDWLLELHYTLLLNDVFEGQPILGTLIGLVVAIVFSFLGISGLVLYRKFWLKFFTFKKQKLKQLQSREYHRLVGIWCSPVLLLVGLTGVYFNTVAFLEEQAEHDNGGHYIVENRLYNDGLDFDELLLIAQKSIADFRPSYLLFPYEPSVNFTVFGEVDTVNIFASQYGSTVVFDRFSGQLLSKNDLREQSILSKLMDSLREIHFGSFAGLTSKLVYFITSVGLIFMTAFGFLMWFYRRKRL